MAKAVQKITLSPSRDIPFNKLVLSQSNVRRVKAGVSIEQLAESIAQRTLLQSLNVRAVLDGDGNETGMFEVPAGGRRYRALELLVKQKRMAKTQLVPCVVREGGIAEDDSIAENDERVGLHPLDQFRAFQTLRSLGMSEEDIAARHFVAPAIVKQRLRLASVSPNLLDVYADDGMTLEQLMAFTVTSDHARQEQVWETVSKSGYDEPYQIRRMLTESTVRASDKRAQFVSVVAYEAAGGAVLRDLFEHDDGGWLQDVPLLDRLVTEKLKAEAEKIAAEGWKWIEVAIGFPYGYDDGLRLLEGTPADVTAEEQATIDALQAEQAKLEAEYQDADELPDEVDARFGEIEWLIVARFIDRVGKGIRGAPRDALVADIAPPHLRGASFGLRQSLDTIGAFLGPLLAIGLMWLTADHFQAVFWIAVIPAFLSVGLILVAVKEPDRPKEQRRVRMPLHRDELRRLGATYWWVVAVAAVFTLARFSEAFLVLRAQSIGLPLALIPIVLVIMSLAYSLSAYPIGVLSDRVNRLTLLAIGLVLLLVADLVLALASDIVWVGIGVVLWGLHMGFTQGLLATLIAKTAPAELRGTAFGMFNLVTGVALLVASVVAGALWDATGPQGTFLAGAAFTVLTLAGLFAVHGRSRVRADA